MSAIKTLLLLLALLCAFHPSPLCEAAVCYVKPTEPHNATCPSEPCQTLDEYVSNSTRYFVSNTVFMFLTGYHHLSYDLTVSDVHNITLRPYIEKSHVVIYSELMLSLTFQLAVDTVIRDMTFQTLGIQFENSTNVTLTGLTVENISVSLNNVFGEVIISDLKSKIYNELTTLIRFIWTVAQSQYTPYTVVAMHELELARGYRYGFSISGCVPGKIVLLNSTISAMVGISMHLGASCKEMLFVCENTHFHNNHFAGLNIYVQTPLQYHEYKMEIALHNVSFIDNYIAITLKNVHNVTISDSYFGSSLGGGAISVTNSILSLMGNITFIDNQVNYGGGAISLSGDSRILIPEPNNTYILFENNTSVNVGGAIYFSSFDTDVIGYCKIYVEQISSKIVFNFSRNVAVNGGNAIYGAYFDTYPCYSPNGTFVQNISQLILSVSSFSPSFADNPSVISSDAQKLCFCDENGKLGNCFGPNYPNYPSVYPGQVFGLPVAALGDMKGLVKWPVYATVDQGEFSKETQHSQISSAERCTYFHYSVLSNQSFSILQFSLMSIQGLFGNTYFYSIFLLGCPFGFALSTNYGCECSNLIKNITCNITEQSIQRQGTTWIGVVENNTSNNTLAFSNVCPFHYCSISTVKILVNQTSFLNEEIQCSDNRSGVLCGGCRDNFSLVLGSNRCLHGCSNNSLSLIIAFATAGIALVFFIKILNLTVSQGTINGLIFYANIVGAEQTVLFSSRAYKGFLSVVIAWVNLDLGIETCFFNGMGAYTKAWLQFVFPVYVWSIALFIIILSHYSIRASRLFGNNSVPVLATLILLTYTKLLRAVISALSITDIQFLNGSTMSVWKRDGNIQYLTDKHIPLFVFAVTVLILFCFPFTLILVSSQWLQKGTHYRVLHWVSKLIPFFDAYTGPLKDQKRYWVGTLLIVRCFYLTIFNIFEGSSGSGVAFISIILAVLIVLAATGFMYNQWYLAVYEIIYILNLGILAAGSLYVQYINDKGNLEALAMTSVGVAFFQFIVTVIYHAYVQLREPLKKLKVRMSGQPENLVNVNEEPQHNEYESLAEPVERPPFQEISNFREPLLAYLEN